MLATSSNKINNIIFTQISYPPDIGPSIAYYMSRITLLLCKTAQPELQNPLIDTPQKYAKDSYTNEWKHKFTTKLQLKQNASVCNGLIRISACCSAKGTWTTSNSPLATGVRC